MSLLTEMHLASLKRQHQLRAFGSTRQNRIYPVKHRTGILTPWGSKSKRMFPEEMFEIAPSKTLFSEFLRPEK